MTRTYNSIKNIGAALIGQGLGVLLGFINRQIFIQILGTQYLGINGLFSNILSLLSLAELGLGSAIIYSLYTPLAHNNIDEIKALMSFYQRAYRMIGIIIATLGLCLLPFLGYLIKDASNIKEIWFIYLLFLSNTVFSYFFAYTRSLIIADQKSYITTIYRYAFYCALSLLQIVILIATKCYYLYLGLQLLCTVSENLCVWRGARRRYPYLKEKNKVKLEPTVYRSIKNNVKAMMCHRLGGVVLNGTDNLVISSFLGLHLVGLYANYILITDALTIIIGQIFNSVTASVGNLNALESKEKSYHIYKKILFFNYWLGGFCSVMLWILVGPFIKLWLGAEYSLDYEIVLVFVINFYITMVRKTTLVFRDACGLFWRDRFKPLVESSLNIIISIILVQYIGIMGVLLGTTISMLTTSFWVEPYVLYRYGFEKSVKDYFKRAALYTSVFIIIAIIDELLMGRLIVESWYTFILRALLSFMLINGIFIGIFRKQEEFKYFLTLWDKVKGKVCRG